MCKVGCCVTTLSFGGDGMPWSPGFLGQWFNNLQQAALLTSSVQYDKVLSKFCQQQLVMMNYVCGFNQSETAKYMNE